MMRQEKLAGFLAISTLALGLTAAVTLPAFAGSQFDGIYNVEVMTDVGNCAKVQRGTVTIQGGHVQATSEAGATAFGLVDTEGTISMQFHDGEEVAHVAGHAKGIKATGTWSAPVSQCGGRWRAERQG